ncbi:discoidin domain-containing protein, partial [Paenibacillus periandrae]|uniref:discoidin domain-containing protein n=1 Tax=Paenibacillus periandrae TaxID=1761741 RepID=UPI001F089093
MPKTWTFEGWNGSSWEVLDTRSGVTDWQLGVQKEFGFVNTKAYTKYRINVSANNGFPSYLGIGELGMQYVNLNPDGIVAMTSNTTPRGIASASGEYAPSYASWLAFDKNAGTGWVGAVGATTGWLAYDFQINKTVNQYSLQTRGDIHGGGPAEMPKTWTFEGWNGSSWEVLDTQSGVTNWQIGEQ